MYIIGRGLFFTLPHFPFLNTSRCSIRKKPGCQPERGEPERLQEKSSALNFAKWYLCIFKYSLLVSLDEDRITVWKSKSKVENLNFELLIELKHPCWCRRWRSCWCSDESGARPWAPTTAVPCLWETQNCGPLQNVVKMTTRTTLVKSKQICVNAKS